MPLLIENKSKINQVKFDRILVVDTEEDVQLKRCLLRDKSNAEEIKQIISSQAERQTRLDAADDILLNTGNIQSLKNKVVSLHKKYLELVQ